MGEIEIVRRAYAKQILAAVDARNQALEDTFAAVAREAFLGSGPGRSCAGAGATFSRPMTIQSISTAMILSESTSRAASTTASLPGMHC